MSNYQALIIYIINLYHQLIIYKQRVHCQIISSKGITDSVVSCKNLLIENSVSTFANRKFLEIKLFNEVLRDFDV